MRASGILLPIFSLPSPGGIGTLGESAYHFVDFLKSSGQRYWQILPLCPAGKGNSPYLSFSSSAGDPYFIDLETLEHQGLLAREEYRYIDFGDDPESVDYDKLGHNRMRILRLAYSRFTPNQKYRMFCSQAWVEEYAMFMSLKDLYGDAYWQAWPKAIKYRETEELQRLRTDLFEEIDFYCFVQFMFFEQWNQLKTYANQKGIRIIGDIPIYVSEDSADVWANPQIFQLDKNMTPCAVSGCPPDGFSEDGQLWGSPLYDWEYMLSQNVPFEWWKRRLQYAFSIFDVVRIDHFRGFESYYSIPYGAKNARHGEWKKGAGKEFFSEVKKSLGEELPIIAEDLGFVDQEVRDLLRSTGFPGMKVLQFAFDSREDNDYLPHNYTSNSVVYIGTHDNATLQGWLEELSDDDKETAREYLGAKDSDLADAVLRAAAMSVSDTAIFMLQDFLGLGNEARINVPGVAKGNWKWRLRAEDLTEELKFKIFHLTQLYGRNAGSIQN